MLKKCQMLVLTNIKCHHWSRGTAMTVLYVYIYMTVFKWRRPNTCCIRAPFKDMQQLYPQYGNWFLTEFGCCVKCKHKLNVTACKTMKGLWITSSFNKTVHTSKLMTIAVILTDFSFFFSFCRLSAAQVFWVPLIIFYVRKCAKHLQWVTSWDCRQASLTSELFYYRAKLL